MMWSLVYVCQHGYVGISHIDIALYQHKSQDCSVEQLNGQTNHWFRVVWAQVKSTINQALGHI